MESSSSMVKHLPRCLSSVLLVASWFVTGPFASADEPEGPLDVDPEEVRAGLIAVYRPLGVETPPLYQIDPKPAFALGRSSPHPRVPDGPFEVAWTGILQVNDPGPLTFRAFLAGELEMVVDGVTVLRGLGRSETARIEPASPLTREPGRYRLTVRHRSLAETPARLQVFWEGPTFARELLPAWRLGHLVGARTPELMQDLIAQQGRIAVGQLGCARCHRGALPGVDDPPPGPALADTSLRLKRSWLMRWLEDPAQVRDGARMPAVFTPDRSGFVERWILAEFLGRKAVARRSELPPGDHRAGRQAFLSVGCAACHFVPDQDRAEQADLDRFPFDGLGDRMNGDDLAVFLGNPQARYPDGRMPRLPVPPRTARDIAAFVLLCSKSSPGDPMINPPTQGELGALARRLGVAGRNPGALATALLVEKGCTACHTGLGPSLPRDVPILHADSAGCVERTDARGPRYALNAPTRAALKAYLAVASREIHPSPVATRRRRLARAGCVRCHQRDTDRAPPIEEVGRTLGGAHLETIPYQRTPRLTGPHRKFTRSYLVEAVREGVSGLRSSAYTYRMPAFGAEAELLLQAIAEADGELPGEAEPPAKGDGDPTVGTLAGPELVGVRGYGCISCHVWNGRQLAPPDPGAVGPDLTRLVGRIRRDWFDRFLEDPARLYPGTPMPAIFPRGQKTTLVSVLDGDRSRQRAALWSYFARGRDAPAPEPPPPLPIASPRPGEPALVAQIPIRLPDGAVVESLCSLNGTNDLLVYDIGSRAPLAVYTGARILRNVLGRTRQFLADGESVGNGLAAEPAWQLAGKEGRETPAEWNLHGYDRLSDGFRVRSDARFPSSMVELEETVRIERAAGRHRLLRELRASRIPTDASLVIRSRVPSPSGFSSSSSTGSAIQAAEGDAIAVRLTPDPHGTVLTRLAYELPTARPARSWDGNPLEGHDVEAGELERPGYRAVAFSRLKTVSGEDRIMPVALAVAPRDGRLFVASLKTGELFVVKDPGGDVHQARFQNYANGLFQEAFSMLAEDGSLYVLHRRNLTRVLDTDGDGLADRFDRVAGLPHGVADSYDYAYGLVRDRAGGFVLSYAPYANTSMPGSGGVLRIVPGRPPQEVACGLRNPLGWTTGPDGEIFFTDNQGEWVAANKLCHVVGGRYYGFPNPAQKQHADRPVTRPVVWVPYRWARSINGVAYDHTGGRFGPFAGQFFLAELMFGGAIVRTTVEQVKGQYQGACFPFWGKGLLGPVSLAFDSAGHLYVGGITEPGWMAQPDRGALFRIDFTGRIPFEMQSIHALARGFRVVFTTPVDARAASDPKSYRLERHRYEYTGAYGSPELDRSRVDVERAVVSADGWSIALMTAPLVRDFVYLVSAPGVRSSDGAALAHPSGAYTVNEVPDAPDPDR
jgi:mono/diheme cytochrome c family protein/glucose/arabinose dehydrogenase